MDQATINRNADRVSAIFNAVAIVVLIVGFLAALFALLAGIFSIGTEGIDALFGGLAAALIIAVYTIITWAGVQLAALVAGYIKVRTAGPVGPTD
jgi:ABC-type uncharacterized transport system permease subunit